MLADLERKIHRILYNYSIGRKRYPSMQELMVKTGKSSAEITESLISLEEQLFIIWDDKKQVETVKILQGWEQVETKTVPTARSNNLDYWTKY